MAWLAGLLQKGGICETWDGDSSYNTAIVTFLNHGEMVGDKTATLTMAHEVGHSFGAEHDPKHCQPGGKEGNYLMFEHASDTGHINNDRFSQCSITTMNRILVSRAHECFTDGTSYCGNEIIEPGEDCDCGDHYNCKSRDPCCSESCVLQFPAQCSPKAGPCCTNECEFINSTERKLCLEETECSFSSYCMNGTCVKAPQKPDNIICNNGSNVCKHGECQGSICSYFGTKQCLCTTLNYRCHVCCNNTMGECIASSSFTGRTLFLKEKTPCADNMYCDDDGQCTEHAHKFYEQKDSIDVIMKWLINKWYVFVLIAIATTVKIVFCSYYSYRYWHTRRSRPQDEVQLERLETIYREYPNTLQTDPPTES
ncbi:disintegrin and metalloproteinase domain-containing protein 10-like [Dendronephthya gigantea]|uniref:disintegrin and metalloproteinase domain-containing protein 10-like n=1 Tax=Dendronephthya gigantea TaxID=151771 RepID=UPI00106A366F|nr:disintegrin and metalloproteinase domain-containing protein 10-like [Dendronephthya gigantea]